jgi:hypothetical protein
MKRNIRKFSILYAAIAFVIVSVLAVIPSFAFLESHAASGGVCDTESCPFDANVPCSKVTCTCQDSDGYYWFCDRN